MNTQDWWGILFYGVFITLAVALSGGLVIRHTQDRLQAEHDQAVYEITVEESKLREARNNYEELMISQGKLPKDAFQVPPVGYDGNDGATPIEKAWRYR